MIEFYNASEIEFKGARKGVVYLKIDGFDFGFENIFSPEYLLSPNERYLATVSVGIAHHPQNPPGVYESAWVNKLVVFDREKKNQTKISSLYDESIRLIDFELPITGAKGLWNKVKEKLLRAADLEFFLNFEISKVQGFKVKSRIWLPEAVNRVQPWQNHETAPYHWNQKKRDNNLYGAELAKKVSQKIFDNPTSGVFFSHRDYCGMGIQFIKEKQLAIYAAVCDGQFPELESKDSSIRTFKDATELAEWLAVQSDESLSLSETGDNWLIDNQTITRLRLLEFIANSQI